MNPNTLAMRFLIAHGAGDDTALAAAHDDTTDYPAVIEALCRLAHIAGPHLRDPGSITVMRKLILGFAKEEQ